MKVLILSCATGQGHNSAAAAVAEALERRETECLRADPLDLRSNKAARRAAGLYSGIMKKAPAVFGAVYRVGSWYSATRIISPIYLFNASYARRLADYLYENRIDAVVCTHLYGMEAMTAVRKRCGLHIPCYGVLTDYTCIPFYREAKLDAYLIPHEALRAEMCKNGIPNARIIATGIPVSARFSRELSKDGARDALGLPEKQPMILLMSGGVGCGSLSELCGELLKQPDDCRLCVLTGRNDSLRLELEAIYSGNARVRILPFTDRTWQYMKAADAVISKPGGLSSTEAAVARVPLVHLLAYSGCETENARFFSALGASVHAKSVAQAAQAAWRMVREPSFAEAVRQRQRENFPLDAADRIAALVAVGTR